VRRHVLRDRAGALAVADQLDRQVHRDPGVAAPHGSPLGSTLVRRVPFRRRVAVVASAMAWITLAGATVELGGRAVLRDISAEVASGDLVVIVGPNGAGKSTLLRAAAGLVEPAAGTVRCMGRDPASVDRRVIARELAYLPQRYELAFPYAV